MKEEKKLLIEALIFIALSTTISVVLYNLVK
jgi:hypothetical protein